jgi:hypothetical protein
MQESRESPHESGARNRKDGNRQIARDPLISVVSWARSAMRILGKAAEKFRVAKTIGILRRSTGVMMMQTSLPAAAYICAFTTKFVE